MPDYAANLRRLMARLGLTAEEVARRSTLNLRTVQGILAGSHSPQARTLHQLATGLNVPADELFQDPSLLAHRLFDRRTNPAVEEVVESRPELFIGWNEADFDRLYGTFGVGGALTPEGVASVAEDMNRQREIQQKVAVLLESTHADLLAEMVELLYKRVLVTR